VVTELPTLTGIKTNEPVEVWYVGEAGGIEQMLAEREGVPFTAVATGQIRGRSLWTAARSAARMRHGARETGKLIAEWRPDVVFMTGGYVAAPVAWAAYRAKPRVPLMIYLPDLSPGRAIQTTSYLASKVAVSFPEVAHYFGTKAVVTGYPVRADLFSVGKPAAWAKMGLQADLPVLLVFGGSRGARSINRAVVEALPDLLPVCQVVHVTGQNDWDASHAAAQAVLQQGVENGKIDVDAVLRYHPHAYMHDMVHALVAADLVVARAGAATLGEFPAARLPAILAPYPFAGQHQDANARYLADRGAALTIPDGELATRLKPVLLDLLGHPERLQAMADAAAALARPDAAANIAAELLALGGRMKRK
jgi:UDP-N-acetylglucosamine--N-acetylmuramyl-(pentapeptide) pyrophosphoryl-undecaprenol N-acetylglucosamine transferase